MLQPLGLITLLTDFGDRDWFVASMKGVVLSINSQVRLVDLTHQIPCHDIEEGAYILDSCYRYYPPGTIHVAVVDPGVGGPRRPLLVRTSRYFFIAPDNGLLSYILEQESDVEAREIENKQFRLDGEGRTFDGRDVFAPAAAWLAKHQPFASFGRLVEDPRRFDVAVPRWKDQAFHGEVVYVDRFGNLITNVTRGHVEEVRNVTKRAAPSIHIAGHIIDGLIDSYSEASPDKPRALINSNGRLEIFVKEASASSLLGIARHEKVTLT